MYRRGPVAPLRACQRSLSAAGAHLRSTPAGGCHQNRSLRSRWVTHPISPFRFQGGSLGLDRSSAGLDRPVYGHGMDTAVISEPTTVAAPHAQGSSSGQVPSVGRIVHVVGDGGACVAGIVTGGAELGFLPVTVFLPNAPVAAYEVEAPEGIGWHWPERVG